MRNLGYLALFAGACSLVDSERPLHSESVLKFVTKARELWSTITNTIQRNETVTSTESCVSYSKVFIFIRHGQYKVKARTPEEKVLTNIGWKQAYEAGRYLKRSGIRIDRIIYSDMIRARQTTAGLLVGLQDECDSLMDLPILTQLSSPVPTVPQTESSKTFGHVPVNTSMLGESYSPYPEATFDCQESRFLAEGSPPVAPDPPGRQPVDEGIRLSVGRRLESGFLVHIHHVPVTLQGLRSFTALCDQTTRLINPCETIVFVGHANVFRFWLCRALQIPAEAWLRFSLGHGSISSMIIVQHIDPSDTRVSTPSNPLVVVNRIGEVGHLSGSLLTR